MAQKPAFIIDIKLAASAVDVNLAPDKREVLIPAEGTIIGTKLNDLLCNMTIDCFLNRLSSVGTGREICSNSQHVCYKQQWLSATLADSTLVPMVELSSVVSDVFR